MADIALLLRSIRRNAIAQEQANQIGNDAADEIEKLLAELAHRDDLRAALLTILDAVDYTANACSPTDMVAACLDKRLIERARTAIAATQHTIHRGT